MHLKESPFILKTSIIKKAGLSLHGNNQTLKIYDWMYQIKAIEIDIINIMKHLGFPSFKVDLISCHHNIVDTNVLKQVTY